MDNQTQLDPQAKAMAMAIRQTESGGNFNAQGKSGEFGAYQFTPDTWNKYASDAGVNVPLQQATPEQQNQVAYTKIKQWKDQGYNVGQVASMWNAGEGKPDAYLQGNKGVNKFGASYDTGAYAQSVAKAYQTIKNGGQVSADPNNPSSTANTTPLQTPQDSSPSVGGFLQNALGSAGNFVGGLANAVIHPIDTLSNLGNLAVGGVEALGGALTGQNVDTAQTRALGQAKDFYNQRYGISDLFHGNLQGALGKIGNTLYKDPVGAAADASMLFGGGELLAGKLGAAADIPQISKAAETFGRAADLTNPVGLVTKGISSAANLAGRGIGETLGQTTGVGYNPIHEAFTNPSPELTSAMRGGTTGEQIVNTAEQGLQDLKNTRASQYQESLQGLKTANPGSLDISPLKGIIENRMKNFGITQDAQGNLDFSRSAISSAGQRSIQEAIDNINSWGTKAGDRTIGGVHTLQQKLADLIPETGQARAFITPLKNQVRDILNQVPGFKEMQATYAAQSNFIDDINKSFLSGNTETAIRKVTQLTRRSNPFRIQLAKQLQDITGVNLVGQAAGSELSQIMPRGLSGPIGSIAEAGLGFLHPGFWAALPLSSPRLVGELLTGLGYTRNGIRAVLNKVGQLGGNQALNVAGRVNQSQQ